MKLQAIPDTQITQQGIQYLALAGTAYVMHTGLKTDAVPYECLKASAGLTLLFQQSNVITVAR